MAGQSLRAGHPALVLILFLAGSLPDPPARLALDRAPEQGFTQALTGAAGCEARRFGHLRTESKIPGAARTDHQSPPR